MSDYDPIPDATGFLARKTPIERHAIVRLLATDGPSLAVMRWVVEQPDCDRATAAMIFWRLWSLPPERRLAERVPVEARTPVLESIAAGARAGRYATAQVAWDGLEVWDRTQLIGAARIDGLSMHDVAVPAELYGPFAGAVPEPASHAFFENDYADDDIFDSMWRVGTSYAAAADWLAGRSADVWMAALDELSGGHNESVYGWMVSQPECPASVAGRIFWMCDPKYHAERKLQGEKSYSDSAALIESVLARWEHLAAGDLDFSRHADGPGYRAVLARHPGKADPLAIPAALLDPPQGREPAPLRLYDDFDFWVLSTNLGGLVPRGRDAAVAEWNRSRADRERAIAAAAPSLLERIFYGGKFTGSREQVDRCWKQFNLVTAGGAVVLVALMRGGAPPTAAFVFFLVLVAVLSVYHASAEMGAPRRKILWWSGVVLITMTLAFLFRWLDKGVVL